MVSFCGFQNACERLRVKPWACTYCFIPVEINGQIEVWPQVFQAFPSFLTTARLITPKLFQAHQLLTVGNCEQLSEALPVYECLHHLHLSPTSFWQYLLAALGPRQACPIFSAPKLPGRCRLTCGLKCLGFDISVLASKSSLWSFQLFDFFFPFIFLLLSYLWGEKIHSLGFSNFKKAIRQEVLQDEIFPFIFCSILLLTT